LRPEITELTSVLVGQVLRLKIDTGKSRLSKMGALIKVKFSDSFDDSDL
jgi:hypothetical protein